LSSDDLHALIEKHSDKIAEPVPVEDCITLEDSLHAFPDLIDWSEILAREYPKDPKPEKPEDVGQGYSTGGNRDFNHIRLL
jgi:hypothetical protein